MYFLPPIIPLLLAQFYHFPRIILASSEQESALFKALSNGCKAVGLAVLMPSDVFARRYVTVLRREIPAGEDVGGGKRGGCLDAVEEKDAVCGGDEEDTGGRVSELALWLVPCQRKTLKGPLYLALGLGFGRSLVSLAEEEALLDWGLEGAPRILRLKAMSFREGDMGLVLHANVARECIGFRETYVRGVRIPTS